MKKTAIIIAVMMLVVVVAGCTTQNNVVIDTNDTITEAQNSLNDFESTLIDENSDVELGSLL